MIFNDKTKSNSNGRSWCWIGDGEHVGPQHVHHTMKHDGESVMIWECMTTIGPRTQYKIEGRMDRHLYKIILESFLWSTIHNYNLDLNKLVFQQDNDLKHTSKIIQEWFALQPFQLL